MRQVTPDVAAVLGAERLALLGAAWDYAPKWVCPLCREPADSRIDDAVVLAYLDGENVDARLAHLACGPSVLLPGPPPPAGVPAGAMSALTHTKASLPFSMAVLIVELGTVQTSAFMTPDGPMVIDEELRLLRDHDQFASLTRDPLCLEALPAAADGWHIERSGSELTRVTAPPVLGRRGGVYLNLAGYEPDEDWYAAADKLEQAVLLIMPPGRIHAPARLRTPETIAATMLAIDNGLRSVDHDDLHPLAPAEHRLCQAIDRGEVVGARVPLQPSTESTL